jgi:hypothetical protein
VHPLTEAALELSPRPLTAVEPEFREDQLARQSLVAHGVKCHVSLDMAGHGMQPAIGFVNQESDFTPIKSRSLQFALVSARLSEWNCSCSD